MIEKTTAEGAFLNLARSILNGTKPSALPDGVTADEVFAIGSRQDMAPITFCALNLISPKSESGSWEEWRKRFLDDCMRSEVQISEYRRLTEYLCSSGVSIIPLKGAVIKNLYPSPGLRVMSDVDLLYEGVSAEKISQLMEAFGYSTEELETGHHDVFHKKPCMNVELHRELADDGSPYRKILQGMFEKADADDNVPNLFHMKPEDLYLHVIVHAATHLKLSGLGIRPVADIYLINRKFSESWDFGYISAQLASVGLERFEAKIRDIAFVFFGEEKKDISDREMEFFFRGSTYGRGQSGESMKWTAIASGDSIRKYRLKMVFMPLSELKKIFPVLKKHPVLFPFMSVYRWIDRVLHYRRAVKDFFSLGRIRSDEIEYASSVLEDFGIEK